MLSAQKYGENLPVNYSPFGAILYGRNWSSEKYRYGFQGQERGDEMKGEGNSVNFTYRMHDPRLGRFFALDPLSTMYTELSPYQFGANQVIHAKEIEGLESENYLFPSNPYALEVNYWQSANKPIIQSAQKVSEINKRVVVNAYKSIYSGSQITAPNLIEHYAYGFAEPYELSLKETLEILPVTGLDGNPITWTPDEWKSNTWLLNGGAISIEKTTRVYARKAGTLGNFSITISGEYDDLNEFVGKLKFEDIYDFDAASHRPLIAETQVFIARNSLPGKPFKVTGILNIKISPDAPNDIKIYNHNWDYITTINKSSATSGPSREAALLEPETDVQTESGNN